MPEAPLRAEAMHGCSPPWAKRRLKAGDRSAEKQPPTGIPHQDGWSWTWGTCARPSRGCPGFLTGGHTTTTHKTKQKAGSPTLPGVVTVPSAHSSAALVRTGPGICEQHAAARKPFPAVLWLSVWRCRRRRLLPLAPHRRRHPTGLPPCHMQPEPSTSWFRLHSDAGSHCLPHAGPPRRPSYGG